MAEQTAVELAILFHNTYEKLAPSFSYVTKHDTKKFDINSPNGKLMVAVCEEIIKCQKHEQQIKEAYKHGQNNGYSYRDGNPSVKLITAEEYYQQTFKK